MSTKVAPDPSPQIVDLNNYNDKVIMDLLLENKDNRKTIMDLLLEEKAKRKRIIQEWLNKFKKENRREASIDDRKKESKIFEDYNEIIVKLEHLSERSEIDRDENIAKENELLYHMNSSNDDNATNDAYDSEDEEYDDDTIQCIELHKDFDDIREKYDHIDRKNEKYNEKDKFESRYFYAGNLDENKKKELANIVKFSQFKTPDDKNVYIIGNIINDSETSILSTRRQDDVHHMEGLAADVAQLKVIELKYISESNGELQFKIKVAKDKDEISKFEINQKTIQPVVESFLETIKKIDFENKKKLSDKVFKLKRADKNGKNVDPLDKDFTDDSKTITRKASPVVTSKAAFRVCPFRVCLTDSKPSPEEEKEAENKRIDRFRVLNEEIKKGKLKYYLISFEDNSDDYKDVVDSEVDLLLNCGVIGALVITLLFNSSLQTQEMSDESIEFFTETGCNIIWYMYQILVVIGFFMSCLSVMHSVSTYKLLNFWMPCKDSKKEFTQEISIVHLVRMATMGVPIVIMLAIPFGSCIFISPGDGLLSLLVLMGSLVYFFYAILHNEAKAAVILHRKLRSTLHLHVEKKVKKCKKTKKDTKSGHTKPET
jgi:hypothetical protein